MRVMPFAVLRLKIFPRNWANHLHGLHLKLPQSGVIVIAWLVKLGVRFIVQVVLEERRIAPGLPGEESPNSIERVAA